MLKKSLIIVTTLLINSLTLSAQTDSTTTTDAGTDSTAAKKKPRFNLRDSQDGAFDLSDVLINAHGFIPVPAIITEPALGGFGGGAALVFMQPPKHRETAPTGFHRPPQPTITMAGGMYTVNNSWAVMGGHRGSWEKYGIHYSGGLAYADINMDFYKSLPAGGELSALIKIKAIPVMLEVTKDFLTYFNGGVQYIFSHTEVGFEGDEVPDFFRDKEAESNLSRLAALLEFDNRDNIFTPNTGYRIKSQLNWSNSGIGSDYDFTQAEVTGYGFWQILPRWVGGLRFDWQQMYGDAPFYLLPYIDLRGVPANRYQGEITALAETEHRVQVYKRWSLTGFAGAAKAFNTYNDFGSSKWVYNYGAGFRYLIARQFKLHMGVDFGFGPDSWAFYIVFGSSWWK